MCFNDELHLGWLFNHDREDFLGIDRTYQAVPTLTKMRPEMLDIADPDSRISWIEDRLTIDVGEEPGMSVDAKITQTVQACS